MYFKKIVAAYRRYSCVTWLDCWKVHSSANAAWTA